MLHQGQPGHTPDGGLCKGPGNRHVQGGGRHRAHHRLRGGLRPPGGDSGGHGLAHVHPGGARRARVRDRDDRGREPPRDRRALLLHGPGDHQVQGERQVPEGGLRQGPRPPRPRDDGGGRGLQAGRGVHRPDHRFPRHGGKVHHLQPLGRDELADRDNQPGRQDARLRQRGALPEEDDDDRRDARDDSEERPRRRPTRGRSRSTPPSSSPPSRSPTPRRTQSP